MVVMVPHVVPVSRYREQAWPGVLGGLGIVLQWLIRYSLVRMTEEEARQYSQYEEGGKSPYDLYGALRIVIIISSDLQF